MKGKEEIKSFKEWPKIGRRHGRKEKPVQVRYDFNVVFDRFRYTSHQAVHLKVIRQVLYQDFLCSRIVLNLNFCIIPQVVHSKLSRQHD